MNLLGICLSALIVIPPFVRLGGLSEYALLSHQAAATVIILVTGILAASRAVWRGALSLPTDWATLAGAAFVIWTGLSITWALDRHVAAIEAIWLALCFLIYLVLTTRIGATWRGRFATCLVASACAVSAIGIAQHLLGRDIFLQTVPPASVFGNKNFAAHYVVMIFPLILIASVFARSRLFRWTALPAGAFAHLFLRYTETRAAWLAAGAVLLILIPGILIASNRLPPDRSRRLRCSLIFLVLFSGLLPILIAPGAGPLMGIQEEIARQGERPTSAQVRLDMWRNVVPFILDKPLLGAGARNFDVYYPLYRRASVVDRIFGFEIQARWLHNDFLQAAADLGIPGLLLYLSWLFAILIFAADLFRKRSHPDHYPVSLAALGFLAAYMTVSFFSFPLHRPIPPLLLAIAAGIVVSSRRSESESPPTLNLAIPKGLRLVFPATALLVALILGSVLVTHIESDRAYRAARLAESTGDHRSAWEHGMRSAMLSPGRLDGLAVAGAAAVRLGRYDEAKGALERVLRHRPWHINSLLNLGAARTSTNDPEGGIECAEIILSIYPRHPFALHNLAYAKMELGRTAEAESLFTEVIAIQGQYLAAWINRGHVRTLMGKRMEAIADYEQALALDPRQNDVRVILERLKRGKSPENEALYPR